MNSLPTCTLANRSLDPILVVDDDPLVRELVTCWLEHEQLAARTAGSAEEARTLLENERFAVVATDICMPGETGLQLLDHVRHVDRDLPVVMLTSRDDAETAIAALTRGAQGYLLKPLERTQFFHQIQRAVDHAQSVRDHRRYTQQLEHLVHEQTAHLRLAHEETIHRLVTASLVRDEETGAHIRRTGLFSEALARACGWDEQRVAAIRLAAPMHDVGKIGIPDGILRKPGPLTPYEFDIMKTHTEIGARMLAGSDWPVLILAHEIALCHHERWDGFGYPRGLAGTAIPESARLVAIADVYDALTHDRIYRPAFPTEEARRMMQRECGRQFEPRLMEIFFSILPLIEEISAANPDEAKPSVAELDTAAWALHGPQACVLESR